jgi:ABC-type multidrug transport system ATPase subunit
VAFTRKMLGRVLLSGEDADKRCGALSGGEAARLVFARIMVEQPNVLVLDEPTNHLDLESIDALVGALNEFEGTLVFVSHDRAFVSALATRVVEIRREGLNDFLGTYEEYLAACGDDHLDSDAVARKERDERRAEALPSAGAVNWEDQKKRKNQRVQWTKRRDEVVKLLEKGELDKAAIHARWEDPGYFTTAPREEQEALTAKERELVTSIDAWMAEWEDLEQKLAALA